MEDITTATIDFEPRDDDGNLPPARPAVPTDDAALLDAYFNAVMAVADRVAACRDGRRGGVGSGVSSPPTGSS